MGTTLRGAHASRLLRGILAAIALVAIAARSQRAAALEAQSFADRTLEAAHARVVAAPRDARGYTQLASGFVTKARESGDFALNAKAEQATRSALELVPDDLDARRLMAILHLTFHRFPEALTSAEALLRDRPDDLTALTARIDALVELGRYPEAIRAAQRRVDLRPDTAAYSRVSYLRSLHGDRDGAIEAMKLALKATDPRDAESAAWCEVHLADELLRARLVSEALRYADHALARLPNYPMALVIRARVLLAKGEGPQAVTFLQRAQDRAPSPETIVMLGDVYGQLGRDEDSRRQYRLLEFVEGVDAAQAATYSRSIALYWADHDVRLDDALATMRRERTVRDDIFTADALAWCAFKKGLLAEAREAIESALRLGTRDSRIDYHAGRIYAALGDRERARRYLERALPGQPAFDPSQVEVARQVLASVSPS